MTDASNLTPHFDEQLIRECAGFYRQYAKTLAHWVPGQPRFAQRSLDRCNALLAAIEAYDALRERCLLAETELAALKADARETHPVQWHRAPDA